MDSHGFLLIYLFIDTSSFIHCNKQANCFKANDLYSLKNKKVILFDSRFYGGNLRNVKNLRAINKLNLIDRPLTWKEYKRIIYRLIANPTPDVQRLILQKREEFQKQRWIGVHIRCGGSLADTKEKVVMIPPSRLATVPQQIQSFVEKNYKQMKHDNTAITLYLSSDSSTVENLVRKELKEYQVITITDFKRGHTHMRAVSENSIRRALVDMYLVAFADVVIATSRSGFSEAIITLGNPTYVYKLKSNVK